MLPGLFFPKKDYGTVKKVDADTNLRMFLEFFPSCPGLRTLVHVFDENHRILMDVVFFGCGLQQSKTFGAAGEHGIIRRLIN